jgi:hypothetical protein
MGNICDLFSFNKEYNKEYIMDQKYNKKNNTNHVPFLDISNIYYDEHAEPPSYTQLRNVKNNEYYTHCD